ncbi:Cytosolic carboxypeptidase 2 [Bulinus truncatus]|nr:Cytosolic carboxypeptidase 2 [Bulinus truncatus]
MSKNYVCCSSYSSQLQDYIFRFRRRPSDVKHWPYGPYWPDEFEGKLVDTPRHLRDCSQVEVESLGSVEVNLNYSVTNRTIETQNTAFKGKWKGTQVVFDSERSLRDCQQLSIPEGCCPTLGFESRFECGNLRQARRIGQYEYELVLKTDLYTFRHTQWYYFRVINVVPGITYKFRIVNLLKRDSLYNHGMRPLVYSEKDAQEKDKGWIRTGHHISYSRNVTNHNCPLLQKGVTYYMLEWQMEFPNADDTYYMAHCYPYSFTDLKEDLEVLLNNEERSQVMKREVLCETRAGNSCFLLTVTNFNMEEEKKAVVITARVHPGESQASWMMKGLLEFITGPDPVAKELRDKFIFKVVPMINPDGVIVGNYRCSLAGRDLNRNYRHPWREKFPTVWYIKKMVEELSQTYEIALYCDLHGHSRKPNVFMYGNNTSSESDPSAYTMAKAFVAERLFPWLMSVRSPEKFHFKSCKFNIRKCKESTGRVVMWRQMRIHNSFTLEATFSGTVLDKTKNRHFNILDFMEMGKILAEVVMDYRKVQEDETKHSKTIRELAKVVTEQILTARGLLPPECSLPEENKIGASPGTEKLTEALLAYLNTPRSEVLNLETSAQDEMGTSGQQPMYSKCDAAHLIDLLTSRQNMDDCFSVLAQLDIASTMEESDSSDSDSESDAEMRPPESKSKKKKRKSKKQRDKDAAKRRSSSDEKRNIDDTKNKSLSALPVLNAIPKSSGSSTLEVENCESGPNRQAANTSEKLTKSRNVFGFVSKYEGRHNGGLPCFTEERSLERAARKIAENRQKFEASKNKDLSVNYVDEDGMHSIFEDDLSLNLNDFGFFRPNGSAGANVRVGYTHANNLQEANQTTLLPPSSSVLPNPAHKPNGYNHDVSSTDSSESLEENLTSVASNSRNNQLTSLPMTGKRNPYQQLEPLESKNLMDFSPMAKLSYISHSLRPGMGKGAPLTMPPPTSNLLPLPYHPRLSTPESLHSALSTTHIPLVGLRSRHSEPKINSVSVLKQIRESAHEDSDCSVKNSEDYQPNLNEQLTSHGGDSNGSVPHSRLAVKDSTSQFSTNHFKSRSIEQMMNHLTQNLCVSPITNSSKSNYPNKNYTQSNSEPPLLLTRPLVTPGLTPDSRPIISDSLAATKSKRSEKRCLVE